MSISFMGLSFSFIRSFRDFLEADYYYGLLNSISNARSLAPFLFVGADPKTLKSRPDGSGIGSGFFFNNPFLFMMSNHNKLASFTPASALEVMMLLKKENLWKSISEIHIQMQLSGAFDEPKTIVEALTVKVSEDGVSRFSDVYSIIRQLSLCSINWYVTTVLVSFIPNGAPGTGTTYFKTNFLLDHLVLVTFVYFISSFENFSTGHTAFSA